MPREIDCPDCAKEESFFEWATKPVCKLCEGTLKVTVYTEAELKEAVEVRVKAEIKKLRDPLIKIRDIALEGITTTDNTAFEEIGDYCEQTLNNCKEGE